MQASDKPQVAPRLALVLGQKLAAQAVPVLGAVPVRATRCLYQPIYEDMAHVQFRGLRKRRLMLMSAATKELVERPAAPRFGLRKIARRPMLPAATVVAFEDRKSRSCRDSPQSRSNGAGPSRG